MSPPQPSSSGTSPSLPAASTSNQPDLSSSSNFLSASNSNGWGDLDGIATHSECGLSSVPPPTKASCNGWANEPTTEEFNGWADADQGPSRPTVSPTVTPASVPSAPSAPPLPMDDVDEGPIHYPAVDMGPLDFNNGEAKGKTDETCCVICWEAPIEGACIPCGHMAGCMSCLTEIKSSKGDCPVCRAIIDQVIRLYAV